MKKIFFILFAILSFNLNNLNAKLGEIEESKEWKEIRNQITKEITSKYSDESGKLSEDISNMIIDFRAAQNCEKSNETSKDLKKDCSQRKNTKLHELQTLIKRGKIAKDNYTALDFKAVIETLSYEKINRRPKLPTSLLFPYDQKDSIFNELFKKDVSDRKIEKVKELFLLAQKIDEDADKNKYPEENENETYKDFYKQERLQELTDEAEELMERMETNNEEIEEVKNSKEIDDSEQIIKDLAKEKEEIKKELDSLNEEVENLEKEIENQKLEKITNTKRLFNTRVDSKGDLGCPNILHFATKTNRVDLVKFIIEKFKETYGEKTASEERTNKKLKRYLNSPTYDLMKVAEAQQDYTKRNKDAKELSACAVPISPTKMSKLKAFLTRIRILDRAKVNEKLKMQKALKNPKKYSTVELAYTFKDNPEASLDILLELIKNGASYREDVILARDKSEKSRSKIDKKLPKYYTTIFDDMLSIGGGINTYKDKKVDLLEALLTNRDKREIKERFESLLDQAIEKNSEFWCKKIFELAKNEDGTYKVDLAYYAYNEDQPLNDSDKRKIQRAKSWANFLTDINKKNSGYYRYNRNKKINEIKKTPLEAARGTKCAGIISNEYDLFVDALSKNADLAAEINDWNTGKAVYSVLHYRSHSLNSNSDTYYDFAKEIKKIKESKEKIPYIEKKLKTISNTYLSDEDTGYLGQTNDDIKYTRAIAETLSDMILNAKDAKGKTPWYYGRKGLWKTYSGSSDLESIKSFLIKTMMTPTSVK